jgi:nucleoside-diphosphate-sugar epimerase
MKWQGSSVLVTGGASFIGSHLVDALVELGSSVTVVDDLSSGRMENLKAHTESGRIEFVEADLRRQDAAEAVINGQDCVFHLAADHGGRGYIDTHQAACAANLMLDGLVFNACRRSGVERVVYASSGCVYPKFLQNDPDKVINLGEDDVGPPYDADGIYGWAKLMGEKTLANYAREYGMKAVSCRYFTVYGPRATENHAVIAMIARAFVEQNPFEVWGTGEQLRNWTYVTDIVQGTIKAAEHAGTGEVFNIGTLEGTKVMDAVKLILDRAGHSADIVTRPDMPTGPYYRVAENEKLAKLSGWRPEVKFSDGLERTMEWYYSTKSKEEIESALPQLLLER